MKRMLFTLVLLPMFINAQVMQSSSSSDTQQSTTGNKTLIDSSGIQWSQDLSWEEVQEMAKREHKYIFIDCFATWCAPCKMMDKSVYSDKVVGDFFNSRFICVKVQMDRTKSDNAFIQSWYKDAELINKQYHIEGYPSFVFLNSDATVVHKDMGGMKSDVFLKMAQTALTPGKVYDDPYEIYNKEMVAFNQGEVHFDKLPGMIKMSVKLNDKVNYEKLLNKHIEYVTGLSAAERCTTANIEMWESLRPGINTPIFNFFIKDATIIDHVMNRQGFAVSTVDDIIMGNIIIPFLKQQPKGNHINTSMMEIGSGVKIDRSEANWATLKKQLSQQLDKAVVQRNMLNAKIEWYKYLHNYDAYLHYALFKLNKYPPELKEKNLYGVAQINSVAWAIFLFATDNKVINKGIKWAKRGVENNPKGADIVDTYANLLYKLGNKVEALKWEEKALGNAREWAVDGYKIVIDQMKKGEHTYVSAGARWL